MRQARRRFLVPVNRSGFRTVLSSAPYRLGLFPARGAMRLHNPRLRTLRTYACKEFPYRVFLPAALPSPDVDTYRRAEALPVRRRLFLSIGLFSAFVNLPVPAGPPFMPQGLRPGAGLGFQGPRGRCREREALGPEAAFLQKGAVQHRGLSGSGVALFAADAVIF